MRECRGSLSAIRAAGFQGKAGWGGTQRGGLSPSGGTWSKEVMQMHKWLVGNEEFN